MKPGELAVELCDVPLDESEARGLRGLYVAAVDGDEDSPCVLLVHGVQGVGAHERDVLERLARAGYHALAPHLFEAAGIPAARDEADAQRAWQALPDRQSLAALELAAGWLAARGDKQSLAVIGFGMGGSLAFMLGCTSRRIAAVVSCCGTTLYPELSSTKPTQPLELFLNLDRPYLGLFAEHDASVPAGHAQYLSERLEAGHKAHELAQYAGTKHGFFDPHGPNYDQASASAAWQRTLAFLKDSL